MIDFFTQIFARTAILVAGFLLPATLLAFESADVVLGFAYAPAAKLDCVFSLGAREVFNGPCHRVQEDNTAPIKYFSEGNIYFLYLIPEGAETAEAWWNGEPHAGHAHNSLGIMIDDGRCWTNSGASLCYQPGRE